MHLDPRGGHNRKKINEDFFKTHSPSMAYILGFIFADGAIIDARKSSRSCYLHIANTNHLILTKIKKAMSSSHTLYIRKPRLVQFFNKSYLCSKIYSLRVGNKIIFRDLIKLGVKPRKSLSMHHPEIPLKYYNFFVRGYFDGDGCLNLYKPNGQNNIRVKVIFTSGSKSFLQTLSEKLSSILNIKKSRIIWNSRAYRLCYRKRSSLKYLVTYIKI